MMIHDVTALAGKYKSRKRIGRGPGSRGKTSGRGHKGAGSRTGHSTRHQFEGGQMPYFRRLAKFGFTNATFDEAFFIVNLRDIVAHPDYAKGGTVDPESLRKSGLMRDASRSLKVLGDVGEAGKLKVKLDVTAHRVSAKARELIEGAGGSVNELGTRRERVRGIDRNADDRTPKNLTKKRKLYEKSRSSKQQG